ncbi:MAG: glucokinase [Hyphomicrobiales bacterium]
MAERLILAADIGGTKTNLALFPEMGRGWIGAPVAAETLRSGEYPTLEAMLDRFAATHGRRPDAASFGFAGAVSAGRGVGTNIPWTADERAIADHLGLPRERVHVVNDLVATGYGIAALGDDDLATLLEGDPDPDGNAAILAAGTGLGETTLVRIGGDLVPVASEGGHADFAPRTDLELDVFRAIRDRLGRVSYESVLSGPGLVNVARVLHERRGAAARWAEHEREGGDDGLPGLVSENGLAGRCDACAASLELFVAIYGAEAGNVALRGLALAGVYLGGGIAPKILPALKRDAFREAFLAKEPHRALLTRVTVRVIRNDRAALLGAGRLATL